MLKSLNTNINQKIKIPGFVVAGLLFLVIFFHSCKKEDTQTNEDEYLAEILTPEEVAILDNMPEATSFSKNTVVLPNGEILDSYLKNIDSAFYNQWPGRLLGPNDIPVASKKHLIAKIMAVALNLTQRSFHQKPDEGVNKPFQNGLAYSWGSKQFNNRKRPPGAGSTCTQEIHGLDCSGFIYQLFSTAGVNRLVNGPANKQRRSEVLQEAISSSISQLNEITVCDLGRISKNDFQSGDIIYWTNSKNIAQHIGMVLKDIGGNLAVFQSNGAPGDNPADCLKNMELKRGARRLLLNDPYWFGPTKPYGITRIGEAASNPEILLTGGSEKYWYQNAGGNDDGGNYIKFKSDRTGELGSYNKNGLRETRDRVIEWDYVNGILRITKARWIGANFNYVYTINCSYPIVISPCQINIDYTRASGNVSTPPGTSQTECRNFWFGNTWETYPKG